mmetsp:Transcript_16945/g.57324  ORF Transcript_16945/g.57324 Transcript_16945/m.57324 type:complete len:217 (+) Transcript_16945:174-824(+)
MGGADVGGWYIWDCFRVAEFAHLWDVFASPQLHAVLATLLGDDFHFLERSEFYVGREAAWHTDVPYGPLAEYWSRYGSEGSLFLEGTDAPRILTVSVYFRDHDEDGKGLSVVPFSHSNRTLRGAAELYGERVLTRAGDAVVFDARLLHRGLDIADADFAHLPGSAHRSVLSVSFGRRDAVSEAWSRGFEMRGKMFRHDTHICPKRDKLGDVRNRRP